MPPPEQSSSNRLDSFRVQIGILCLLCFGVWAWSVTGEFVWIDRTEITEAGYRVTNWEDFRALWSTSLDAYLERSFGSPVGKGGYLRPVYALSISLDWFLWRDNYVAYHIENILWHLLVVSGLLILARRFLEPVSFGAISGNAVAFFSVVLFAVHPFGVHSITWISGRKDTMCAAFSIWALAVFAKVLSDGSLSWRKTAIFGFLGFLLLNLGLLSKELALVVPAFATVWLVYLRDRNPKAWAICSLFWLAAFMALAYRFAVLGGIGLGTSYPAEGFAMNGFNSLRLIVVYAVRILLPFEPTIVDRWPISTEFGGPEIIGLTVLPIAAAAAWLFFKRHPAGLLLGWFAIWLLPATGVVPLRHLYAERYLYPASFGLLSAAIILVANLHEQFGVRKNQWFVLTGTTIAVLFSILSWNAIRAWQNDQALFEKAVAQDKYYVEGLSALAMQKLDEKEYQESLDLSRRALESAKDDRYQSYWSPYAVYLNAGQAAYHLGRLEEAKQFFQAAEKDRPKNALIQSQLAQVFHAEKDFEPAIVHYENSLRIRPDDEFVLTNLAQVLMESAQLDKAIQMTKEITARNPKNLKALSIQGSCCLAKSEFKTAEKIFAQLVQSDAQNPTYLAKYAWSLLEQKKFQAARNQLDRAKNVDADLPIVKTIEIRFREKFFEQ